MRVCMLSCVCQFEVFYLFFLGRVINGRYSDSLRKVRTRVRTDLCWCFLFGLRSSFCSTNCYRYVGSSLLLIVLGA